MIVRIIPFVLVFLCAAAHGADHAVSSGTSTVDCDTFNGGVSAGDTLTLAGGTRGPLTIEDCSGTSGDVITVRNDPTANSPTTIQSSSTFALLMCDDCHYVTFDGTGGWDGMPAGASCGTGAIEDETEGTDGCGIVLQGTGSGSFNVNSGFRPQDQTTNLTFRGIEVDGGAPDGVVGIGISTNDQTYCQADEAGEQWRENILIEQVYLHDTYASLTYIGSNWNAGSCGTDNLRMRNITVRDSLFVDAGRTAIHIKSTWEGDNDFHGNRIYRSAIHPEGGWNGVLQAVSCLDGSCNFFDNYMEDAGEHGIKCRSHATPSSALASMQCNVYGNVIINSGVLTGFLDGHGITLTQKDSSVGDMSGDVYYNTVAKSEDHGVNISVDGTANVRDNIVVDSGGSDLSGGVQSNNLTGSGSSVGFVNYGGNNLELTSGSSAVDAGVGAAPNTDILGTPRPQGSASDQGAYEFEESSPGGLGIDTSKPSGSSIDTGATHYFSHLYDVRGTSNADLDDEGSAATDIDLSGTCAAETDAAWGQIRSCDKANKEYLEGDFSTPLTYPFAFGIVMANPSTHVLGDNIMSLADKDQDSCELILRYNDDGTARTVAFCGAVADVNVSNVDLSDGNYHLVIVRVDSDSVDMCVDGGAYDTSSHTQPDLLDVDRLSFGMRRDITKEGAGNVDVLAAFLHRGDIPDCSAVWNDGDIWDGLGITGSLGAPILQEATVPAAGNEIDLTWGQNVSIGSGGNGGLSLSATEGAIGLTFDACVSATCTWTFDRTLDQSETITATYTNPGDGVENGDGTDAANFSAASVANESTQDSIAPTIGAVSVGANGDSVSFRYSEVVSFGAGGNSGHALSMSGGAVTLTYSSGSGTDTLVYSTSRSVGSSETGTAAYTQPGNGVEDASGNDLASYSDETVLSSGGFRYVSTALCANGRWFNDEAPCPSVIANAATINVTATQMDVTYDIDEKQGETIVCVHTSQLSSGADINACSGGQKATETTGYDGVTVTGLTTGTNYWVNVVNASFSAAVGGWYSNVLNVQQATP